MKIRFLFILAFAGILTACFTTPSGGGRQLSSRTFDLVQNAVFEVVVEKPVEDPVVYDRELNWDNVPFVIKNDKYYSIGTAFAISRTELITAFHVINLAYQSMVYDKYFIRDSQGQVFELDQITGGSNEQDYLIFTVKGKTFDRFFQLERNYRVGDTVFSIGNALGEGIVVRNGLVLGTVPEEDSGRWDLLKSSADGNPGNSGGPLVTPDGKVIAVVTALRDNILYSTPASVVLDGDRSRLPYRARGRFGHLILPNRHDNIFQTSVALPASYIEVRRQIRERYAVNYDGAMTALFTQAPEYLTGPNNVFLLNSAITTTFPEISFVDPNDNNWKLSGLNARSYNLDNNGRLMHVNVSGYNFYKIRKPTNVPLARINTDPKYILDLILQNIRTDRTLWGSDRYRILSLGDPSSVTRFRDALGRTWISVYWLIEFDDKVQIMYILPMPDGPVVMSSTQNSAFLQDYQWDLKKLCDHLFAGYFASFSGWNEYFAMREFIPTFFENLRFQWNERSSSFAFSRGGITINADSNVFNWTNESEMFVSPIWYKRGNNLEFGIKNIVFNRDIRGRDYFLLFRNTQPDSRLGTNAMENWNDIINERFPFDGNATVSARENTGSVGAILNTDRPGSDTIFSLYLSMESPQNEENISRRFAALREGVSVRE
ncbi:MAG: serine protease [Treponema sp.]|nr:serine protease [Treponema sp.]MCL2237586.1 serine protease [Treponema sp.]